MRIVFPTDESHAATAGLITKEAIHHMDEIGEA